MTDLERRLVKSLEESADLIEEWIAESPALPPSTARMGGDFVNAVRSLAVVVATVSA